MMLASSPWMGASCAARGGIVLLHPLPLLAKLLQRNRDDILAIFRKVPFAQEELVMARHALGIGDKTRVALCLDGGEEWIPDGPCVDSAAFQRGARVRRREIDRLDVAEVEAHACAGSATMNQWTSEPLLNATFLAFRSATLLMGESRFHHPRLRRAGSGSRRPCRRSSHRRLARTRVELLLHNRSRLRPR